MSIPPPPASAPAGWYPDPWQRGQRYWDGNVWTDHLTPLSHTTSPPPAPARTGDWVGGVLLSLLLPVVGFIAGIVYVAKGGEKRQVGIMCMVLSTVVFFGWLALASSGASDAPSNYPY